MMEELFDRWNRKLEELFDRPERKLEELFHRPDKRLDEMAEEMRVMDQRASSPEQDARQPRLALAAERASRHTKTRERTESALQQFKRCMRIAVLPTGLIPTRCILQLR